MLQNTIWITHWNLRRNPYCSTWYTYSMLWLIKLHNQKYSVLWSMMGNIILKFFIHNYNFSDIIYCLISKLGTVTKYLSGPTSWKYGSGKYARKTREILCSVCIKLKSDKNKYIEVRHPFISSSSQFSIGRNVTPKLKLKFLKKMLYSFHTKMVRMMQCIWYI